MLPVKMGEYVFAIGKPLAGNPKTILVSPIAEMRALHRLNALSKVYHFASHDERVAPQYTSTAAATNEKGSVLFKIIDGLLSEMAARRDTLEKIGFHPEEMREIVNNGKNVRDLSRQCKSNQALLILHVTYAKLVSHRQQYAQYDPTRKCDFR
jgi:hypothetical protein